MGASTSEVGTALEKDIIPSDGPPNMEVSLGRSNYDIELKEMMDTNYNLMGPEYSPINHNMLEEIQSALYANPSSCGYENDYKVHFMAAI